MVDIADDVSPLAKRLFAFTGRPRATYLLIVAIRRPLFLPPSPLLSVAVISVFTRPRRLLRLFSFGSSTHPSFSLLLEGNPSDTMNGNALVNNQANGLPEGSKVTCRNHPVLHHKLTKLRDERTDSTVFRHLLREVTFYLGCVVRLRDCFANVPVGTNVRMT